MKKNKINVFIDSSNHSTGRGVGVYSENLVKYLSLIPEIELTSNHPDIIHYPFFDLFFKTLPIIKKTTTVVTIHDLTPLILSPLYPKGFRGNLNLIHQKYSLNSVNAIITDSINSKNDIIQLFKVNPDKIHVIYLAADPKYNKRPSNYRIGEVKQKYHLPEKFVLTVPGGPNPNKNLPQLAQATKMLSTPLVIVGNAFIDKGLADNPHPELKDLKLLRQYNHIIYPGFVPTNELICFYHLASLYCCPSLYEGFGLPLLEAMNAGCLLVSSNTSSLPEIYPKDTLNFDPYSLNSLTNSLSKALSLDAKVKQKILKDAKLKAKEFSWEKTARLTYQIYRQLLS